MGRMPKGRNSINRVFGTNFTRIAALACLATQASAQPLPREVIIAEQGARLHAGPSERLYTIQTLRPGTRLQVVGEPQNTMLPVAYPSDLPAYIPATNVETNDDKAVRIIRATRLLAPHATEGAQGSWRSLLAKPIRPGAVLAITSTVRDDAGKIIGYMVAAPPGATAFVSQTSVTQAAATDTPAIAQGQDQVAPQTDLLQDMVPTGAADQPADTQATDTANIAQSPDQTPDQTGQPTALATNDQTLLIEQGATASTAETALDPVQLESLYQSVRTSDSFEEELDALLSEHQRSFDALPDDIFNERTRAQLKQRIAFLQMRIAFRDGPARLASERDGEPSVAERMAEKLEQLAIGKGFTMVGRLVPSRIYDGRRLPKLYRIRSTDALARTLGYVQPGENDYTKYLNHVVGLAGTIEDGPGGAKVITPNRIEIIADN